MKVFITGATGYIGSAVAERLRCLGHQVVGLARSDSAAAKLEQHRIEPYRGDLFDAEKLINGAKSCDAVIHAASPNDVSAARADQILVNAVLKALAHSNKPFLYTSGVWVLGHTGDRVADENWPLQPTSLVSWRPAIEKQVLEAASLGIRSVVIRPGIVYGKGRGLPAMFTKKPARTDAVIHFIGDGGNRWPLVHVDDLADLYALALEKAPAGTLLHAVHGPAVRVKDIAAAAVQGAGEQRAIEPLSIEEARKIMGAYADALALDQQVSGERAKQLLGWNPHGRPIREEFLRGSYGGTPISS